MPNGLLTIACCAAALALGSAQADAVRYAGVNLAGAEFGGGNVPGIVNKHYTYPNRGEIEYFAANGMTVIRLPFLWERLQRELNAPLDPEELGRIRQVVDWAAEKKVAVILDPHNYARYRGKLIGSPEVPTEAFADFWSRLATAFRDDETVIFGLVNEPHGIDAKDWVPAANAAIRAIRAAGAGQIILVPGVAYSGAHSWTSTWYGTPNGEALKGIVDPGNNLAFEVHQYLDSDSSGRSPKVVSETVGAERLKGFTAWLRENKAKGFLGEFGVAGDEESCRAMDIMLDYVDANTDVWLGWTYWAAGPWWGDYMYTVEPKDGKDRPQMKVLRDHAPERQ